MKLKEKLADYWIKYHAPQCIGWEHAAYQAGFEAGVFRAGLMARNSGDSALEKKISALSEEEAKEENGQT